MAERTDTEVAVDLLRSYAAGDKDRPGRPAVRYVVELIDQLDTHVADARLDAEGWKNSYEAMRSVARRYRDDWIAMEDHTGTLRWRKRSWNPPKWADLTDDEHRALDELETDRGQ